MILISFILFALTLLVILWPIIHSKDSKVVSLQDIYTDNFITLERRLNKSLTNGLLTHEEYESQKTEAARSLLRVSRQNNRKLSSFSQLCITFVALLFPIIAIIGFWQTSYSDDEQEFDTERSRLITEFTDWQNRLDIDQLDSLNSVLLIQPQPQNPEIFNELKYGLPALFFMSARENHTNTKTLKLLGKILYDVQLYNPAYQVFSRTVELSPKDYMANSMIISMELEAAQGKLTPSLERKINIFLANFPLDTLLRMQYAQILYENHMPEKSVYQWEIIREILANKQDQQSETVSSEEHKQFLEQRDTTLKYIDQIISSIKTRSMETSQVRNFAISILTNHDIDLTALDNPAILTLYVYDLEENTPIAFKELILNQKQKIPSQITFNDFNRFNNVSENIRNFEHLSIFATIKDSQTNEIIYATDLAEIPRKGYESEITFDLREKTPPYTPPMEDVIALVDTISENRIILQVDAPNIDLNTFSDDATLGIFVSPKGSRMPLAAKSIPYANQISFPLTIIITDQNKLMEQTPSLFSLDELEIGARLSHTQELVGQIGDVDSEREIISKNNRTAILKLDQIRDSSKETPIPAVNN